MLLALILGPMMEEYLRRAMLMSRGNPMVFLSRPISCVILIVAAAALIAALIQRSAQAGGGVSGLEGWPHRGIYDIVMLNFERKER